MKTIDNISEYQCGELPTTAEKLDAPVTTEDMMKKSQKLNNSINQKPKIRIIISLIKLKIKFKI